MSPRNVDPNPRMVYITKTVIEKFRGTKVASVAQPPCCEQCRERMEEHIRRDPTEKERWCAATRKIQEFVNKYGLTRKDEEPRVCRMNDGEDEEEESVGRSHARVFITRCRCRSSRPLPRLPQKQVERKHLLLVAKGTWTRIGSKSRRRFRGVERADSENVTNGKMRIC